MNKKINLHKNIRAFRIHYTIDYLFYVMTVIGMVPILEAVLPFDINSSILSVIICILLFLLFLLFVFQLRKKKTKFQITKLNLFLLISLAFSLLVNFYSRVCTIIHLNAPILHDPIAHALWAKSIVNTGEITYFYSPFLHSITASLYNLHLASIPKLILVVTNLSYFLLPVIISLAALYITGKRKIAIILFFFFSIASFPLNLYYTAGKNSLSLGLLVFVICLYFYYRNNRGSSTYSIFTFGLGLFVLFLTHYPTFGLFMSFLAPIYIYQTCVKLKRRQVLRVTYSVIPYLVVISICLIWFLSFKKYDNNPVEIIEGSRDMSFSPDFSQNILDGIKQTIEYSYSPLLPYLQGWQALILIFLVIPFTDQIKRKEALWISWLLVHGPLLVAFTILTQFQLLNMVQKTMQIVMPSYYLTSIVILIGLIWQKSKNKRMDLLIFSLMTLLLIVVNVRLAQKIDDANTRFNPVQQDDLEAFEYIRNNIDSKSIILNNAIKSANRGTIVFPTDGGMWIPVFTDNPIVFDFAKFSLKQTHKDYDLYQAIKDNEQDDSAYFNQLDVEYIYLDQAIYARGLHEDDLDNVKYEVIFSQGGTKILRLTD